MYLLNADRSWLYATHPFPAFVSGLGRKRSILPIRNTLSEPPAADPPTHVDVVRTRRKGSIVLIPLTAEEVVDDNLLLLAGIESAPYGGASVLKDGTTGTVISVGRHGWTGLLESSVSVAAILEPDQSVALHRFGRGADEVIRLTWGGGYRPILREVFGKSDWDIRMDSLSDDPAVVDISSVPVEGAPVRSVA